jgi:hypothetical protein
VNGGFIKICMASQRKPRNYKLQTDGWHVLCREGGGFIRWLNQQEFPVLFDAADFSALLCKTAAVMDGSGKVD